MQHRVLFTASTYSHIVNFHRPYLRAFQTLGWHTAAACGGTRVDIPETDQVIHLPFEKSMFSPKNLKALILLRRELQRKHYDLISCHTSLAAFFTRMAVWGIKDRPVIVCTVHGYLFDQNTHGVKRGILSLAERLTAPVTDLLMTMNHWDTKYARAHRLGRRILEIPGIGVDFSSMRRSSAVERQELRGELGFQPEDVLLVYAAEFSKRKSQEVLLRALTQLPDRVKLLLPGDGVLKEECQMLCQELGLADRVVFPGKVQDMPRWYSAADAAVSASRSEGLPFNIMEAMYFGLPIVASEVKGHVDLIESGENGLLYPYGDAEACAVQLRKLLDDSTLAARLGQQAAQSCRNYDLSLVLPEVMAAYRSLGLPMDEPAPARV